MATGQPSPDFVDLWKRSAVSKDNGATPTDNVAISRTKLSERLSGERSTLWTNLSQMSPTDQAVMMTKLTSLWPYDIERRALNWPMHVGIFTNMVTASLISTKINADMVLMSPRTSFLEAVRKCPKSPFVFGVYSSGLTYFVLQTTVVMPTIYREVHPCSSCILTQSSVIALTTGILMPLLATPYLCYYVLLQRKNEKFPPIKNALDFVMLSFEGSRAARPLLAKLIPLQIIMTALSTYCLLWGRQRVFNTMDADPDLAKELLVEIQAKPTIKERVVSFLRGLPLVSDVLGREAPENERV